MKRRGTWKDGTGIVHRETGMLRAAAGGWTMLMRCGVEARYDLLYRFTRSPVDCMTCLVKDTR